MKPKIPFTENEAKSMWYSETLYHWPSIFELMRDLCVHWERDRLLYNVGWLRETIFDDLFPGCVCFIKQGHLCQLDTSMIDPNDPDNEGGMREQLWAIENNLA